MKKITSAILAGMLLAATSTFIFAANAGTITPSPRVVQQEHHISPMQFQATISFQVFEGEGCECIPLTNVPITAFSKDTYENDSNVTNDEGFCTLRMNYDETYQVHIVADNYESVLYDFKVLDNQPFVFNLKKSQITSNPEINLLDILLYRFIHLRQ